MDNIEKIAEIIKSDPAGYIHLMGHDRRRVARLIVDAGYRKPPKKKPRFSPGYVDVK